MSSINTTPSSPTLKWRVGCPNMGNDTDCTTGLEAIGQTWSAARVAKIPGYTDTATPTPNALPVLVMGGGYDPCEDADPDTCGTTKGNRIFVLDADTGDKLAELNTDRGVVGDVFVITDETTGLAKWAYAADLGGNIYRISSGTGANTEFQASDHHQDRGARLCHGRGLHPEQEVHDVAGHRRGSRRQLRDPGRYRRPREAAGGLHVGVRRQ
jgi:type IV pilus assembly protein PilY1